ncbi:MAG: class I SAM-dependent methyltransferase [Planctomycetes bacterium]|nr:class I SAM-dependent methyltransferase [Planctomycetota bacterium]
MDRIERVSNKWQAAHAGEHYRGPRFGSRRARERDPGLIAALLARCDGVETVLDSPCGAGRLTQALAPRCRTLISADVSAAMLAAFEDSPAPRRVQASLAALPFRDRAFDAVVCCRFLHHLHEPESLERAAAELARVARRYVIASFWDSASLPALRVRMGLKRSEGPTGRVATSRARVAESFSRVGLRAVEFRATLRFVSQQTFALFERVEQRP